MNAQKKETTQESATVEVVREFPKADVKAIEQARAMNEAREAANNVEHALSNVEGATVRLSDTLADYVKSSAFELPVADAVSTLVDALSNESRPRGTVSGYGTQVKAVLSAMHASGQTDSNLAYIMVAADADTKPSAFASVAKAYKADGTLKAAANAAGEQGKKKTAKPSTSPAEHEEVDEAPVHDAEVQNYNDNEQQVFDALNSGNDRALINAVARLAKRNGMAAEIAAKTFSTAWENA